MVARVGGRARSLVQALRKVQRERTGDPSKFTGSPKYSTETMKAGGKSTMWLGGRKKTRETTGLG